MLNGCKIVSLGGEVSSCSLLPFNHGHLWKDFIGILCMEQKYKSTFNQKTSYKIVVDIQLPTIICAIDLLQCITYIYIYIHEQK